MAKRMILLFALGALLLNGVIRAGDNPEIGTITAEKAALSSDAIFVGKIITIDEPAPGPPGAALVGIKVGLARSLKGQSSTPQVRILLTLPYLHGSQKDWPRVETSYVFFLSNAGDYFTAIKSLPASDDNIATVKKLIAQLPAK